MSSSGDEGQVTAFPRFEYEAIEKAVMESARGRWFLQEFARRNRAADTLTLLDAISRLQIALGGSVSPAPPAEIVSLAAAIRSTRSEMARTRNDMLPGGGTISDDSAIYATIVEHAKTTASEIMAGTQNLQRLASELKAANSNDEEASRLEESANSFQTLAWSQDLLSRCIAKAMGLLSHVDDRIAAMTTMVKPPAIEPRHLKYFAGEEGLFEPAAQTAPAAPASEPPPPEPRGANIVVRRVEPAASEATLEPQPQSERPAAAAESPGDDGKKRIVIIRKASGETVEIPFAGELPERVA